MKYFTKYSKVFLVIALVLTFGSCTKNYEELNTNPNSPTDVPAINIFTHVITSSVGNELGGWIQHTYLGCWSQQWCKVQYIDEDRYQTRDMTGYMEGPYTNQLLDLQLIIDKTSKNVEEGVEVPTNQALLAAAKIMKVWVFSYLTDLFGDIPYSEALQGLYADGVITAKYDSQADIYADFFKELEEANTLLDLNKVINFGSGDLIFDGDPALWKKFGNSLHLRLLNRTAGTPWSFTYNMAGGATVTTDAGAASFSGADAAIGAILGDPSGHPVMESNDDNAQLAYPGLPYRNPIYNTLYTRTDQGIAETIVEFLKARNDPRLPVYAQPTQNSVDAGTPEYVGNQNGRAFTAADFPSISKLGLAIAYDENAPVYVLCYDEVEFIKAEYALRNGQDGTAQAAYEAGVTASLERWGTDPAGYLSDPLVAWGSAADDAHKYQLINEQRWAGAFGQGVQAWNLVRRTGFPARVFEYQLEGTAYPNLGLPIRIRYSLNEEIYNPANLQEAQQRQNLEATNETMFSTNGTTSQMWWHTRKNPIPTDADVDVPAETK